MNNYLDSIVNELKDFPQSNSEILNLIQSRKNVYNHFKREFIKNINTIENEDLIAFALLIAAKNTDFELHQILSEHFDFNNINNPLAILPKVFTEVKVGKILQPLICFIIVIRLNLYILIFWILHYYSTWQKD